MSFKSTIFLCMLCLAMPKSYVQAQGSSENAIQKNDSELFLFAPLSEKSQNRVQLGQGASINYRAAINSQALQTSDIIVNLPTKSYASTLMVGTPVNEKHYSFKNQQGSAIIFYENNSIQELLIHDVADKKVLRGSPSQDGSIEFIQQDYGQFVCDDFHPHSEATIHDSASLREDDLANLSFARVSSLASRPNANKVIYIDYYGGSLVGTYWNSTYNNGAAINYLPYSRDDNYSSFSPDDLYHMYVGWAEMAEDFSAFNVNITTDAAVFNAASPTSRSRIIATSTSDWFPRRAGGVALLNSFGGPNNARSVGWTFNSSESSLGVTHSHEAGHQLGLLHDGEGSLGYFSGHQNWGPIMGAPFGKEYTQWSRGRYLNANQTEDDLAIIGAKLGVLPDDFGDGFGVAQKITKTETVGFIRPDGLNHVKTGEDEDIHLISLDAATKITLIVRPLLNQHTRSGGGVNLSAKIQLYGSSGVIAESLPSANAGGQRFEFSQELTAGDYYLVIESESFDSDPSTGFEEYANGGYYQILYYPGASSNPDLVVEAPMVRQRSNFDVLGPLVGPSNTINQGAQLAISASVVNKGNVATNHSSAARVYRSLDSTITTQDTVVNKVNGGSEFVFDAPPLEPDESATLGQFFVNGPSAIGTYYYGVCVDDVSGEAVLVNNCSVGVPINVIVPPDLGLEIPAISASAVEPNDSFDFMVTINNQGGVSSEVLELNVFQLNQAHDSVPKLISTENFGPMLANSSMTRTVSIIAPSQTGSYFYYATVSDLEFYEGNIQNNESSSVLVSVDAPGAPDLFVEGITISDSSPFVDENFSLGATIKNIGTLPSSVTTLRYFRSPDPAMIADVETLNTATEISVLNPAQTSATSATLSAGQIVATFYYQACIDVISGENINNNCSAPTPVRTVARTQADLIVSSPVLNPISVEVDDAFSFSVTVENQGSDSSEHTQLLVYLSDDNVISSSDNLIGEMLDVSPILVGGPGEVKTTSLSAPLTAGAYFYGACVVAVSGEIELDNNCSVAATLSVTSPQNIPPDAYELDDDSTSANIISKGETQSHNIHVVGDVDWMRFTLSDAASNVSIQTSGNEGDDTILFLYDELFNEIANNDDFNGLFSQIDQVSLAAGTYYVVVSDFNNDGTISSYNVSLNYDGTASTAPDLQVVSPGIGLSSVHVGHTFTFFSTVQNQGDANAAETLLSVYVSSDSLISTNDDLVGDVIRVSPLNIGNLEEEIASLFAPSSPGAYFYGACVASVTGEVEISNNCSTGVLLTVINPQDILPDSFELDNDSSLANIISKDEIQSHSIHIAGDEDWMQFTLSESAGNVIIRTSSGENSNESDDTVLFLYDEFLNEISSNDDFDGLFSQIDQAFLEAGTYFILVREFNNTETIENYDISLAYQNNPAGITPDAFEIDNDSTSANVILRNEIQSRNIHIAGDQDWMQFTLFEAANNVVIQTSGNEGGDTVLILYDELLNEISNNDDFNDLFSQINQASLAAGTYYILVHEFNNSQIIPSYDVLLEYEASSLGITPDVFENDNDSASAKVIAQDETQSRNIHVIGDEDWLQFTLSETVSNLTIQTSGNEGDDTVLFLYDENLNELSSNDDFNGLFSQISQASIPAGTYYIVVHDFGNDGVISSYNVNLEYDGGGNAQDEACFVIKAKNNKVLTFCL